MWLSQASNHIVLWQLLPKISIQACVPTCNAPWKGSALMFEKGVLANLMHKLV